MLSPDALMRHAGRLLAGQPDEADARRAISACYYAAFNLLITAAAETQGGTTAAVQDSIRRSIAHREVRRVCDAIVQRPASRPLALQSLLVEPLAPGLIAAAKTYADLQNARLTADYDLAQTVLPTFAVGLHTETELMLASWPTLLPDPNTRTFLLALLFFDRWTRRT